MLILLRQLSPLYTAPGTLPSTAAFLRFLTVKSWAKKTSTTPTTLNDYFGQEWGSRWPQLVQALQEPIKHVALLNAAFDSSAPSFTRTYLEEQGIVSPVECIPSRFGIYAFEYCPRKTESRNDSLIHYPPPPPATVANTLDASKTSVSSYYWLDLASILPPLALDVQPGQKILDMCAAPGGKSVVICQLLFGGQNKLSNESSVEPIPSSPSLLVSNDIDARRRERLVRVLHQYTPARHLGSIWVTGQDGGNWAKLAASIPASSNSHLDDGFDRILIDAPCSSDRHVLLQLTIHRSAIGDAVALVEWSAKRCKLLAKKQFKLICSGIRALVVGGRLVYSTCSIASIENDEVVEKVLERAAGAVKIVDVSSSSLYSLTMHEIEAFGGEKTRYGWIVLPDKSGYGPMYFSVLEKVEKTDMKKKLRRNKYAEKNKVTI